VSVPASVNVNYLNQSNMRDINYLNPSNMLGVRDTLRWPLCWKKNVILQ
jgi:hypothetical protein